MKLFIVGVNVAAGGIALIAVAPVSHYAVSFVVLSLVSKLVPLTGRRD